MGWVLSEGSTGARPTSSLTPRLLAGVNSPWVFGPRAFLIHPGSRLCSRTVAPLTVSSAPGWAARDGREPVGGPGLEVVAAFLPTFQEPEFSHLASLSGGEAVGEPRNVGPGGTL